MTTATSENFASCTFIKERLNSALTRLVREGSQLITQEAFTTLMREASILATREQTTQVYDAFAAYGILIESGEGQCIDLDLLIRTDFKSRGRNCEPRSIGVVAPENRRILRAIAQKWMVVRSALATEVAVTMTKFTEVIRKVGIHISTSDAQSTWRFCISGSGAPSVSGVAVPSLSIAQLESVICSHMDERSSPPTCLAAVMRGVPLPRRLRRESDANVARAPTSLKLIMNQDTPQAKDSSNYSSVRRAHVLPWQLAEHECNSNIHQRLARSVAALPANNWTAMVLELKQGARKGSGCVTRSLLREALLIAGLHLGTLEIDLAWTQAVIAATAAGASGAADGIMSVGDLFKWLGGEADLRFRTAQAEGGFKPMTANSPPTTPQKNEKGLEVPAAVLPDSTLVNQSANWDDFADHRLSLSQDLVSPALETEIITSPSTETIPSHQLVALRHRASAIATKLWPSLRCLINVEYPPPPESGNRRVNKALCASSEIRTSLISISGKNDALNLTTGCRGVESGNGAIPLVPQCIHNNISSKTLEYVEDQKNEAMLRLSIVKHLYQHRAEIALLIRRIYGSCSGGLIIRDFCHQLHAYLVNRIAVVEHPLGWNIVWRLVCDMAGIGYNCCPDTSRIQFSSVTAFLDAELATLSHSSYSQHHQALKRKLFDCPNIRGERIRLLALTPSLRQRLGSLKGFIEGITYSSDLTVSVSECVVLVESVGLAISAAEARYVLLNCGGDGIQCEAPLHLIIQFLSTVL